MLHLRGRATGARLVTEKVEPETLAYTLVEHVADQVGEDALDAHLVRVVAEVFAIQPGVLSHVIDKWFTDLKEEVVRREDPRHARAVVGLIEAIEEHWRNERG